MKIIKLMDLELAEGNNPYHLQSWGLNNFCNARSKHLDCWWLIGTSLFKYSDLEAWYIQTTFEMLNAIALKIKNTELEELKLSLICGKTSPRIREWIRTTTLTSTSWQQGYESESLNRDH